MSFAFARTSPESSGIPSSALLVMMHELNQKDSLHSIMILRHGKVCLEGWWAPYCSYTPHALFSLSKSFTSLAIGLAAAEKRIRLSDTMLSFFPEYDSVVSDPKMREITLRDLLTMGTGHSSCARAAAFADPDRIWARGFIGSKLDHEPGTFFAYNSAGTYMLSAIIRKVTGMNVREYLIPRLFDPLEITPGPWENCPLGINIGGSGLYLKTEDLARVGQLILQHGVWNGKQILPEEYLAEATCKQIDNSSNENPDWKQGYGYQFWISRHGFRGDGASGQYIIVLPQEDIVIATTASVSNMQSILEVFWKVLLPALKPEPLPEDPGNYAELTRFMQQLEIPRSSGLPFRQFQNKVWKFQPNSAGITQVDVTFPDNTCRLEFHSKYGHEILIAGFDRMNYTSFLHLNDAFVRPVIAQACRTADDKLDLFLYCLDGSFRDVFHLDFSDSEQPLRGEAFFSTFRNGFLPKLIQAI